MSPTKQNLIKVIGELPIEKLRALFYFAEWLYEAENLTPEELKALTRGKEQFKKGEYVFFKDIKR